MDITPFVYPPVDQEGVELSPAVSALFEFALETGTVTKYNCFLIKKTSEFSNNTVEPVDSTVSVDRVELATSLPFTGFDYGDDPSSGELYRSKITIQPKSLLESHTEYSAILSKEISAITVFDPEEGGSNTGDIPSFKGPFMGLSNDFYTIDVTTAGDHSSALYSWTRDSDSYTQSGLTARKRYIEIDQGVFIKFPTGNYASGDSFIIRVIPQQKFNTTVSWDFSTGDESVVTPEDEKSGSVVDVPVNQPGETGGTGTGGFALTKVTPYDGQTLVDTGSVGSVVINGIVITTEEKSAALNDRRVKIIDLIGVSPSIYDLAGEFIIEIDDGVTTNQEVIDLINNSTLGIYATNAMPTDIALLHTSGLLIQGGKEGGFIVFEFNKNIDQTKFDDSNVKAIYESLVEVSSDNLDFTYEITDNELKIQF